MQKVGFSLFEENSLEKSMTFKNPSNQSEILHIGPDYFQYEFPDKENDGLKLWFNNYFTIPNIKFIGAYQQNIPEYNRAWFSTIKYYGTPEHTYKIASYLDYSQKIPSKISCIYINKGQAVDVDIFKPWTKRK